jgi:YebC/PmpR family DNA-binding regulatory protein
VICDILTDNRNRTAPEVRKIFEMAGGKLGATGCVAWMFDRKGLLVIPRSEIDEESLLELALEAGADDVRAQGDNFEVTCEVDVFRDVCEAVDRANLTSEVREISRIPKDVVDLDVDDGKKVLELMERLDDHDDVQNVSANFNIPDEVMAEIETQ